MREEYKLYCVLWPDGTPVLGTLDEIAAEATQRAAKLLNHDWSELRSRGFSTSAVELHVLKNMRSRDVAA